PPGVGSSLQGPPDSHRTASSLPAQPATTDPLVVSFLLPVYPAQWVWSRRVSLSVPPGLSAASLPLALSVRCTVTEPVFWRPGGSGVGIGWASGGYRVGIVLPTSACLSKAWGSRTNSPSSPDEQR